MYFKIKMIKIRSDSSTTRENCSESIKLEQNCCKIATGCLSVIIYRFQVNTNKMYIQFNIVSCILSVSFIMGAGL